MNELGLDIPRRCAGCPRVLATLFDYELNEERKETIESGAIGGFVEFAASFVTSHSVEFGLTDTEDEASIGVKIRQAAARTLDEIDTENAIITRELQETVSGCKGLLRMRATRDGITYTAAICASQLTPQGDSIEHVIVGRQS